MHGLTQICTFVIYLTHFTPHMLSILTPFYFTFGFKDYKMFLFLLMLWISESVDFKKIKTSINILQLLLISGLIWTSVSNKTFMLSINPAEKPSTIPKS